MIELFLGGARSGKSRLAEEAVLNSGKRCVYLATSQALDSEMQKRIKLHQDRRDERWQLIEEPLDLAETLQKHDSSEVCILVDCLTLWLTNCLLAEPCQLEKQKQALLDILPILSSHIVFVSNEVGQGVVPMDALSRRFVDESGLLHQDIAKLADKVTFVTAGLPQILKDSY